MKPFRYDFTFKNTVIERKREKFCSFCRKKRKQVLKLKYSGNLGSQKVKQKVL